MHVRGHGLPVLISVGNSDFYGSVILANIEKKECKDGACTSTSSFCIVPGKIHLSLVTKHPQKKKQKNPTTSFFPFIAERALPYLCLFGSLLGQEEESYG